MEEPRMKESTKSLIAAVAVFLSFFMGAVAAQAYLNNEHNTIRADVASQYATKENVSDFKNEVIRSLTRIENTLNALDAKIEAQRK